MRRIEDYALVGDLQTAVLVDRSGSIDWCCFPRFDSPPCLAALLGGPDNGRWSLAPMDDVTRRMRRYRHDTLILESEFETVDGRVRAIDFMPPRGAAPDIVRIVEGLDGKVRMRSEIRVRFDYGHIVPWVRRVNGSRLIVAGPDALRFSTPVEVHGEDFATVSEFTVAPGQRVPFVLTWFPSHQSPPDEVDPERALDDTEEFWLDWANRCTHEGEYHEEIHQSLLVLKALTYAPTGGIVAAPTTSLPEQLGGVRNWDYRFCWLRDATLTLRTMLSAGYREEAQAWRDWLFRAIAGDPADVQIMYGLAGERRLDEREIEWLGGFENSAPVRSGNAAHAQLQLDVFGEVLDAAYANLSHGAKPSRYAWSLMSKLLDWLEDNWCQKDSGLWEVRGPTQQFTHSKLMCWVAFDRGVQILEEFDRPGPAQRWRALRDEIHAEVLSSAWSERRKAFAQAYGSDELDAAVLLMPLTGFLPASDPRIVSTVDAIRRELTTDGLVRRYETETGATDGLPPGEGVFLACSFWLVSVLELQGRHDEARELFERLLDLRNDVGLLAEEYDPVAGRQLGNFPQAFSHLALVDAALALGDGRSMHSREDVGRTEH